LLGEIADEPALPTEVEEVPVIGAVTALRRARRKRSVAENEPYAYC
jgi:hypothetical protein